MNVTAHREGAAQRKIHVNGLAGPLLGGIKRDVFRIDIDLMQEFVLVGEADGVALGDHNLVNREIAPLLRHGVERRGKRRRGGQRHGHDDCRAISSSAGNARPVVGATDIKQRRARDHADSMRLMKPPATLFIASIVFAVLPGMARAQTLSVNSLVDLGLSIPSETTSWMKGGLGKLDNGGGGRKSIAPVGQALTDLRLDLDPSLVIFATARFAPDQHAPFDLLEAYTRYQPVSTPNWLWSIKMGAFFAPISPENEGVGWTSPWTLTPSAINSWVGDELRTIGGETTAEWRYAGGAFGLTGAVFGWNDPAGALLADRGWVFDSRPIGLMGEPRVPDAFASNPPLREEPFKEIGGQPGWYAGASVRQDELGRIIALYYDNRALFR
ncbi:MAG: hypothetical protein WA459_14520 [Stellaceae bacterium]